MHLHIVKSKNAQSLYVIRSTYKNGRNSSERVEKLGTYDELLKKLNGQDPIAWAKAYIAEPHVIPRDAKILLQALLTICTAN